MEYFPLEILQDIFARLPLKSMMRFKCLTKQWTLLFCNSKLIKTHLGDKDFVLHYGIYDFPQLLRLRVTTSESGEGSFEAVDLEYPTKTLGLIKHMFQCDDILCMFTVRFYAVVWNLRTKQHERFPMPEVGKRGWEDFGFGYDSATDDYKVIYSPQRKGKKRKVWSLMLKIGHWNVAVNNVPFSFRTCKEGEKAITVNGCLYWIARRKYDHVVRTNTEVILCYDLKSDSLREETSLSDNSIFTYNSHNLLGLLHGSLCLASTPYGFRTDFWLMEENAMTKTKCWVKMFRIPKVGTSLPLRPICFTKNGQFLTGDNEKGLLFLFDLKDGSVKEVPIHGLPYTPFYFPYSLPWYHLTPYVESSIS